MITAGSLFSGICSEFFSLAALGPVRQVFAADMDPFACRFIQQNVRPDILVQDDLTSVGVAALPTVDVAALPTVDVAALPTVGVAALPTVDVAALPTDDVACPPLTYSSPACPARPLVHWEKPSESALPPAETSFEFPSFTPTQSGPPGSSWRTCPPFALAPSFRPWSRLCAVFIHTCRAPSWMPPPFALSNGEIASLSLPLACFPLLLARCTHRPAFVRAGPSRGRAPFRVRKRVGLPSTAAEMGRKGVRPRRHGVCGNLAARVRPPNHVEAHYSRIGRPPAQFNAGGRLSNPVL